MNRGDVVWVEFPVGEGRAQAGRRPAVVLQNSSAALPTVLVVPLSTQLDALRFPGTMLVEPDTTNGLRHSSVALVFQLRAVDRRFIGSRAGALSAAKLTEVFASLDEITGR
jgi:mRNA interferase MazF